MISISIADDEALIASSLATLLSLEPDLDVRPTAGSGEELIETWADPSNRTDVCVLDLQLGGIDGIDTELTLDSPTLLVIYEDRPGMLSRICAELAYANINIGVLKCSRQKKGGQACSVIETDSPIPQDIQQTLTQLRGVQNALILNPSEA